jgi:glycosyltransferase involved in cell wall biosynthesis
MGIPIVSSDLPAIREYFSAHEVRFFAAGDAESLADAIVAIADDARGAKAQATRARARYETYRWSVNRKAYVELLDALVSDAAAQGRGLA